MSPWALVTVETLLPTCGANQVVLWYSLKLASGCFVSGVYWERLPCRPISALPITSLRLPGKSQKAICGWPLPVLDLEAHGGSLAVNRGYLLPIVDLRQLSKRPRVP